MKTNNPTQLSSAQQRNKINFLSKLRHYYGSSRCRFILIWVFCFNIRKLILKDKIILIFSSSYFLAVVLCLLLLRLPQRRNFCLIFWLNSFCFIHFDSIQWSPASWSEMCLAWLIADVMQWNSYEPCFMNLLIVDNGWGVTDEPLPWSSSQGRGKESSG